MGAMEIWLTKGRLLGVDCESRGGRSFGVRRKVAKLESGSKVERVLEMQTRIGDANEDNNESVGIENGGSKSRGKWHRNGRWE